jgi:hypothetical protein
MSSRRDFLRAAGLGVLGVPSLFAQPGAERTPDGAAAKDMVTPAAQRCIDLGLDYLARSQHRDGSFGERHYTGNVAITSLAGLAFMAAGHQAGRGLRGQVVLDALQYVMNQEDRNPQRAGFLNNPRASPHGPMYSHGFGTLFLAEAHGTVHSRTLRETLHQKLKRAVELIIRGQNPEGGWRYLPEARDADVSVTVCQIMALRAARNAGVFVPKSTAGRCIEYVKKCQTADGGFRYMMQGGPPAFARTAAGVAALHSAGVYKGPEVERGLRYLMQYKPNSGVARRDLGDMHYFYGHYYAAQVMWTAGGNHWTEWYPAIRDELIARAGRGDRQDGAWFDTNCTHYGTAMACIILQIPNNYLSILQK